MNKIDLSERDICTKYIIPAIAEAGWDIKKQIREEYSASGKINNDEMHKRRRGARQLSTRPHAG